MGRHRELNLVGRSHDELLIIATRACDALALIASHLTTDEGDPDDTEDEFGLAVDEVVGMAHDNMISRARSVLDSIITEFPSKHSEGR